MASLLVLSTSSVQFYLEDEKNSDYKPTSGRDGDCEEDYEDDVSGCNADSQCQWDYEDDECDEIDDDDSDDSDSSDSSETDSSD
ncbi:MAG: hypothetical protein QGF34_06980, partial [Candidatus Poseidoniaceae archaeon]|nr:hypothetical protein [Candidatus Poseidoniaceae archaeon]